MCAVIFSKRQENKKINKNKKTSSSEETVRAIVHGGRPGGRSETAGGGCVGFKPGVKK